MSDGFIDLRQNHAHLVEESFWPSFTDIMTVVVMIFLIATSILIVKNWELVNELQSRIKVEQKISQRLKASMAAQQKTSHELEVSLNKRQEISRKLQLSMEAERRTSEVIQQTSKENATLEERLAHSQSELSMMRLQLMQARESAIERDRLIVEQDKAISNLNHTIDLRDYEVSRMRQLITDTDVKMLALQGKLGRTIEAHKNEMSSMEQQIAKADSTATSLQTKLEVNNTALDRREKELEGQLAELLKQKTKIQEMTLQNEMYLNNISNYEQQIASAQQQHSILVGDYESLENKYNKLIKPSRSAIGKYMVEVRYEKLQGKDRIQFRESADDRYEKISSEAMHKKLSKLKAQYKDNLYVKIIIPDNSGLSYSEAWTFMLGLLQKYDYYYQDY